MCKRVRIDVSKENKKKKNSGVNLVFCFFPDVYFNTGINGQKKTKASTDKSKVDRTDSAIKGFPAWVTSTNMLRKPNGTRSYVSSLAGKVISGLRSVRLEYWAKRLLIGSKLWPPSKPRTDRGYQKKIRMQRKWLFIREFNNWPSVTTSIQSLCNVTFPMLWTDYWVKVSCCLLNPKTYYGDSLRFSRAV